MKKPISIKDDVLAYLSINKEYAFTIKSLELRIHQSHKLYQVMEKLFIDNEVYRFSVDGVFYYARRGRGKRQVRNKDEYLAYPYGQEKYGRISVDEAKDRHQSRIKEI